MAQPPSDTDLAIRIEKLADYVARNGVQFEHITRQKQQGNPEFQFLDQGDPNHGYYRHVLNCLQNGGWTLDQVIQIRNQSSTQSNNLVCYIKKGLINNIIFKFACWFLYIIFSI